MNSNVNPTVDLVVVGARGTTPTSTFRSLTMFAIAVVLATGACLVTGHAEFQTTMVVYQEPPPPKTDPAHAARPGFVWVAGHWELHDTQWQWIDGKYDAARAGYVWTDGRWERRGNAWHWVYGTWTIATAPRD